MMFACKKCTNARKEDFRKKDGYYSSPKYLAKMAVKKAKTNGTLTKMPCSVCGEPKSSAHHYNGYEEKFWLDVVWLCEPHHVLAHKASSPSL